MIPSPNPAWTSISIGPLNVYAYALFIVVGIAVALWITTRRWRERGGNPEVVGDIAIWAVPFGIIGGRIYHVISTPGPYFGPDGNPADALRIWNGGLGIWGAIALGALGAYIGARRAGVSFSTFVDAAAPGVLIAQAIGRLGNYANQELFGGPTEVWWSLQVDAPYRPAGYEQFETFHPTFLYELLWNLAGAALIIWLDRRLKLRGGRVFWLYVVVYVTGRLWIEMVRIDEAVIVLGLRVNVWVSIAVLTLGLVMFVLLGRRHAAEPESVPRQLLAAPTIVDSDVDTDTDMDAEPVASDDDTA